MILKLQHISLNDRQTILQRKNMAGDTQQLNSYLRWLRLAGPYL